MKNNFKRYLLFSLSFLLIWGGCRKAEGPVMNYAIAAPDSLQLSTNQQTLIANWSYPSGQPVTQFIVELSSDEDFSHLIASDTLPATARKVSFDSTGYKNAYYFRILAQSENLARNTDYVSKSLIFDNNFLTMGQYDVTAFSVILKWNAPVGASASSILLIPDDSSAMTPIELSQSEIKENKITIGDLQPLTTYTAILYSGEKRQGVTEFTTKDPNAKITINSNSKTFRTLPDAITAANSGDTINIGGTYDFSSLGNMTISKSLFIRGLPEVKRPKITIGGFNLEGDIGDFTLYRLNVIGTSSRLFGLNSVSGKANLKIDSCNISGYTSGLVECNSSDATYGLIINNSLIHDFGQQGNFINFKAGTMTQLDLENSTFWNVAQVFFRISMDVTFTGNRNPIMKNCTLNKVSKIKGFIDIRSLTTFISVNKCILSNRESDVDNIFFPHCSASSVNVFGTNSDKFLQYFFGGTTNIKKIDPQYKDPNNGDFTVGSSTLRNLGWGDPRWIQ